MDSGIGSCSSFGAKKSHQRLKGDTVCNKTIEGFITNFLVSTEHDKHELQSSSSFFMILILLARLKLSNNQRSPFA